MQQEDQQQIDEKKKMFLRMMLLQWKKNKLQKQNNEQPEQLQNQVEPVQNLSQSGIFSREEYAQSEFWDKRYQEHKGYFDWYVEYPQLREYFRSNDPYFSIPIESKILIVGCGNSKLSEQMFDDGYKNILSTDISKVVIEKMNDMAYVKGKEGLKFQVMDSTSMDLPNESYEYIIDKGTLDALACDHQNDSQAQKLVQEMCRVAKFGVILISHSSCQSRRFLFKKSLILSKFQFYENKVSLSNQSELINIIRTQLKDKPMAHILQDKDALVKCLNLYKHSLKNQIQKQETQNIIFQFEDQENQIKNQIEEIPNESTNDQQIKTNEEEKKIIYAPKRQNFCYIYIIKKF